MNAQELRIGNLLRDKLTGAWLRVDELRDNNIITYVIDREKYPLPEGWKIEPIPLTEEILLKAGFEKDGYGSFVKSINPFDTGHKNLVFAYDYLYMREGDGHPKDDHICTLWNKDLKKDFFLHQLQNLYFALTGKELEINL